MATLPSLTKTHAFSVNQQIPAQGTVLATSRKIWRQVVTTLLGFALNPFTVDYSCDSITAGTKGDGVNRWSADSKLNWPSSGLGTMRSWIVLKSDAPNTGFELLICCDADTSNSTNTGLGISIVVSFSNGFTGGTTTAKPTATDQKILSDNSTNTGLWSYLPNNGTTPINTVLHAWMSSDGQICRLLLCSGNYTSCFALFMEKVNPQISSWATPMIAGWFPGTGLNVVAVDCLTYANMVRAAKFNSKLAAANTDNFALYLTVEGCNASTVGEQQTYADDDSMEWPMLPVGLFSLTAGYRGRKGLLIDFWMGATLLNNGDTYPDDATKQFAHFGDAIYPWNGTTPVIS